jgi:SAM-dependent methyltransferase
VSDHKKVTAVTDVSAWDGGAWSLKVFSGREKQHLFEWMRYLPELLSRAGLTPDFLDRYVGPPTAMLPEGAGDYLVRTNPRLLELRAQYAALRCDALHHTLWNESYVATDLPFYAFRADSALVWQHRDFNIPTSYALTYYYLKGRGQGALLERLPEDVLFGAYGIPVDGGCATRDRLDSACEIAFLESRLQIGSRSRCHVLDIGSGYGRLAHRLVQAFDHVSVTCADAVPEVGFLCEYYLRFRGVHERARMVSLGDLRAVLDRERPDVAVNIHSFPECSAVAIRWWLDLLREYKVPHFMLVPNSEWHGGSQLLSAERRADAAPGPSAPDDVDRPDVMQLIEDSGYRLAESAPKYDDPVVQRWGVSPTYYYLFERF